MPPSPRLLHSKFEYSLRSVSGADVAALNTMSNMKQFSIMVVVVDFLLRLVERCPTRRRFRVIRVGVSVAIMMDGECGTSVQNRVKQRKARGRRLRWLGISVVADRLLGLEWLLRLEHNNKKMQDKRRHNKTRHQKTKQNKAY